MTKTTEHEGQGQIPKTTEHEGQGQIHCFTCHIVDGGGGCSGWLYKSKFP